MIFDEPSHMWRGVYPKVAKCVSTVADMVLQNFVPSASVLYRAGLVSDFPDWISHLKMGDWPLHVLYAQKGDIGFIGKPWSVYRVHTGGVWSQLDAVEAIRCDLDALNTFIACSPPTLRKSIEARIADRYRDLGLVYLANGDATAAKEALQTALAIGGPCSHVWEGAEIVLATKFPRLYRELSLLKEKLSICIHNFPRRL
jgi:hypothetical protein